MPRKVVGNSLTASYSLDTCSNRILAGAPPKKQPRLWVPSLNLECGFESVFAAAFSAQRVRCKRREYFTRSAGLEGRRSTRLEVPFLNGTCEQRTIYCAGHRLVGNSFREVPIGFRR